MLARVLEVGVLLVVSIWISRLGKSHPHCCMQPPARLAHPLPRCVLIITKLPSGTRAGGLSLRPTKLPGGGNDTGKLFNVHPVIMITAFGVVMAEALQSWRAPILPSLDRRGRLS